MCGRYVLAMRPSEVRAMLQANDMLIDDAPPDDGPLAPRQSYNFAPTYHGIVLRAADAPAPPQDNTSSPADPSSNPPPTKTIATDKSQHYILQTMKWGLIPSWTAKTTSKTSPQKPHTTALKTINCRSDTLASGSGMWSRLRHKRRCIVFASGFYEWLKTGPKSRVPYYIKRADGLPFCFAGLWDYVPGKDGGEGVYSYTIVTTESCGALRFLHDRMPVVIPEVGGEGMRGWLGVGEGSFERVGGLLRPWEGGLEVYRVSGDVGRVGRDERRFVEPVGEEKGGVEGWLRGRGLKGDGDGRKDGSGEGEAEGAGDKEKDVEVEVKDEDGEVKHEMKSVDEVEEDATKGVKRETEGETEDEPPRKKMMGLSSPSPVKSRPNISATRNVHKSPKKGVKGKGDGSHKITKFFGNSA